MCERVDRERAEARRAAGVGPEEWVDDWWVEKKEGEIEQCSEDEEGEEPGIVDDDKGENPECMSGIEGGVHQLGL